MNATPGKTIPPLAGLCSIPDAMKPGLSVEECVRRLKRYHYSFKRLHQILTARITAEPLYELKTAFSHHAYLCAEHVMAMRTRVAEMREPPLGLEVVPDPALETLFDEILCAPSTGEVLVGIYEVAMPDLRAAIQRHIDETNKLADAPTVRVCRFAILELDDMIALMSGHQRHTDGLPVSGALGTGETPVSRLAAPDFVAHLRGGVRKHSSQPYRYDRVPQRDARFIDPYNRGVNPEALLYSDDMPVHAKVLMMFYKRIRELDVPEMMASIITETHGKPWGYYLAMSRQLWDEARHAMMGEVGFNSLGIDWTKIPITWTWSLNINTQLKPIERHAVLYFIEQGLMPRTGKRYEFEVANDSGNALSKLFQDYDWADEVLHSAIGRQWYVKDFPTAKEAIDYGDRCWSKVVSDYRELKEKGLTNHDNWWPDVYRRACEFWGIDPDPRALAFNVTYETVRADLKPFSESG